MELKIDENLITNSVRKSIDKLISEELGISNEVKKVINGIYDMIKSLLRDCPKETIKEGLIWKKSGTIEYNIFGDDYSIIFTVFNFLNEEVYENCAENIIPYSSVLISKKIIEINSISISGVIDESTFSDSMQHEIEHLFQIKMQGKPLFFNNGLYDKAIKNIRSNENNGWISRLSTIIYYTRNEEHDAFVNGLYAQLIRNDAFYKFKEIIRKSDAYKISSILKVYEKELIDNFDDEDFIKSAKFFNKSRKWFISQCDIGVKKIIKKIMKVAAKAEKDFKKVNEDAIFEVRPWFNPSLI